MRDSKRDLRKHSIILIFIDESRMNSMKSVAAITVTFLVAHVTYRVDRCSHSPVYKNISRHAVVPITTHKATTFSVFLKKLKNNPALGTMCLPRKRAVIIKFHKSSSPPRELQVRLYHETSNIRSGQWRNRVVIMPTARCIY